MEEAGWDRIQAVGSLEPHRIVPYALVYADERGIPQLWGYYSVRPTWEQTEAVAKTVNRPAYVLDSAALTTGLVIHKTGPVQGHHR